ncbi:MAG: aldo/keto reductase [Deltaproteobacteria bacterium]|nr:aldo/keto reductase [Deltaproteobacteria bacterium]
MLYRRFGRTELQIPVFSCGGMRFQQSWSADKPVSAASQSNLDAVLAHAFALGINHVETARGYGTSEAQLGKALRAYPRNRFILQSKVAPTADPKQFEANLEQTFERLQVSSLDLFAFHGVNNREVFNWMMRDGGCLEVAERFRAAGRLKHIGFSTHASLDVILETIETNRFDYVNLHWYFIFQENAPAIAAATARDMGVFIISPTDKGGHLHTPRPLWLDACAPLSPLQFNDLFCLSNPAVHTLSVGAARPSDFDAHVAALANLPPHDDAVKAAASRLQTRWNETLGDDFAASYLQGVPEWERLPEGVNVRKTLWLWGLIKAWDLLPYARSRYNMLSQNDPWFPGYKAIGYDERKLRSALAGSPHVDRIMQILPQAHHLLHEER